MFSQAAANRHPYLQGKERFSYSILLLCCLVLVCIGRIQETLPFLGSLHLGLVLLALAALVVLQLGCQGKFRVSGFDLAEPRLMVWLLAVALVSTLFSISHRGSFYFMTSTFLQLIFIFFFVINVVRSTADIVRAIWAFLLGMLWLALPSVFGESTGIRWSSLDATYDPNDLALLFNVALCFVVCLLPRSRGLGKVVLLTSLPVFLYALVLTGSRGGMLGFIAVTLLLLFRTRRVGIGKKVIFLIALLALGALFTPEFSRERYATIGQEDYNSTDDFGRLQIWKRNLELLAGNPLLGVGPGSFGDANGRTFASEVGGMSWRTTAHNSFLLIGVEMGLIGVGVFLALLLSSLARMRALQREQRQEQQLAEELAEELAEQQADQLEQQEEQKQDRGDYALLALALEAGLTAYLVCGFFLSVCYWVLPYFLVALGVALQRAYAERRAVLSPGLPGVGSEVGQ